MILFLTGNLTTEGSSICVGGSSAKTDRKQELNSYGQLNQTFGSLFNTGRDQTRAGASDTGQASRYYSAILSGNPTAVMDAAAPEINTIGKQADQQKKDIATFGNRTGGTNQTSQAISTANRGQVSDVISQKRGQAAGAEASIGAGETAAGIGATQGAGTVAANLGEIANKNRSQSQQIHDAAVAQWGKLISDAFSYIPGATGDIGSNLIGDISGA